MQPTSYTDARHLANGVHRMALMSDSFRPAGPTVQVDSPEYKALERRVRTEAAMRGYVTGEKALACRPTVREIWTRPLPIRGEPRANELDAATAFLHEQTGKPVDECQRLAIGAIARWLKVRSERTGEGA